MNAERDYLVNFVFPKIEDYCRQRYLEFTPIDLRWGIPEEDSRNGLVLRACLEEVDNSRPFFVGILGERYGWTPGEAELDSLGASLQREQDWLLDKVIDGASITEMEIDYGVLRDMNIPHACFFIRSADVEIPDEFKEPPGSSAEKRLNKLKAKIRGQKKYGCYEYSTPKELGDRLYNELLAMIEAEYPPTKYDSDDALAVPHEMSLERRAKTLCDITHYRGDFDKWIESMEKVFMVRSRAGGGSSTVLAYCVKDLRAYYSNSIIYFDFESLPPVASPVDEFMKFMALERNRMPDDKWNMVAIDNASMLYPEDIDRLIEWIDALGNNVHVAFSVKISSDLDDMIGFRYSCPTSTLNIYTLEQRLEVIDNYTRQYGKRLTAEQQKRIAECKYTDDPTTMNILLDSIVAHGQLETLDERIDRLLKAAGVNDIFYTILSEGEKAFHSIGLRDEYAIATSVISFVPAGISEKDLYKSMRIPKPVWLTIRPYVMRFCRGNENNIALTQTKWRRDVKMFWGASYRAVTGKRLIDWYLADPKRYSRGARIAAAVYEDIWHLPLSETEKPDDSERIDLNRKMLGIALSPDLTKTIPTGALGLIFSLTIRDGIAKAGEVTIYGRKPELLSPEEQYAHYSRLARIFTSFNRTADAAWCYDKLHELYMKSGDCCASIYKAQALLLLGQANNAIDLLKSSGLTGITGLSALFRKKPTTGSDLKNKINALSVMVRAYSALGQWKKMQNSGVDIEKAIDAIDENTLDKETVDNAVTAITEITLMLSMYGTPQAYQQAGEISRKMNDLLKTMGIGHPAVYNDLLGWGIRELRRGEYKDAERWLRKSINSAWMAFGCSCNNVLNSHTRSYQYNRAANLYAIAYYHITGKYYKWSGIGYNFYMPLDCDRTLKGLDTATVDKDVKKTILLERDFYKNAIRSIQPAFKQKEMDAEPDKLREELGL